MCDLQCTKWAIAGAVTFTSIIGVALPWVAKDREFILGSLFSGGILIAAALCHLLDDAQDGISDAIDEGSLPDFPWAMLLFACGYLFMMVSAIPKIDCPSCHKVVIADGVFECAVARALRRYMRGESPQEALVIRTTR
jgi:hypothetical protein